MTTAIATTQHGNAGDYSIIERTTTDDKLVSMWLHSGRRGSDKTRLAYRREWERFAAAIGKPIQAVTLADLLGWKDGLTGKPATIKRAVAAIRSLFAFAQKVGYIAMNPAIMVEPPKVSARKAAAQHVLTYGQIDRIRDACQTPRETALVEVLYSSGARISEVLGLTWRDVTPRAEGGALLHIVRKGGESDDQEPPAIGKRAYSAILALKGDAGSGDYVFATASSKPVDRMAAHKTIKRLLRRAGLPEDASAHWFRHSHATHAIDRGASLADVRAQLGHASLQTTTVYAHRSRYSSDVLE